MLVRWLAIVLLALQGGNQEVWIQNNEVWIRTSDGPRQLTSDGVPKRLAVVAPDRTRVVYVLDQWLPEVPRHKTDGVEQDLVEIGTDGTLHRHILPEGYVPRPFDRLDWIGDRRIGAMACGHANCEYWVIDADTGKTAKVLMGGFDFVWSHNYKWVARRTVDYFGTGERPSGEFDGLLLNETEIYPPPKGDDCVSFHSPPSHIPPHGHTVGTFRWSPHDAWLGFTDRQSPEEDTYVVAVNPRGVVVRAKALTGTQFDAAVIDWADDSHFHLVAGPETLDFVIEGRKIHRIQGGTNSH
jgi:hypothetical protein